MMMIMTITIVLTTIVMDITGMNTIKHISARLAKQRKVIAEPNNTQIQHNNHGNGFYGSRFFWTK
jgi:hypothetical protein